MRNKHTDREEWQTDLIDSTNKQTKNHRLSLVTNVLGRTHTQQMQTGILHLINSFGFERKAKKIYE